MNEHRRLRDIFEHARSADVATAPAFGTVLSRRRGPGVGASCAGVALLAAAAFVTFSGAEPPRPAVSIAEWRSPTAFLLETTGNTLLRDLPEIGSISEEDLP